MSELVVKNASLLISRASSAWKYLHGTINVYKPAGMRTTVLINAIKTNICNGKIERNKTFNTFKTNCKINGESFRFKLNAIG